MSQRKHSTAFAREMQLAYRPGECIPAGIVVTTPTELAGYLQTLIGGSAIEKMIAVHLNVRLRVLGYQVVGVGSVFEVSANIGTIAKGALLANAAGVVMAHNHPSGELAPSEIDRTFTKDVYDALQLIGIDLLDHLIVGPAGDWVSLYALGDMPWRDQDQTPA